jgi:hypothetical protein
VTIGKRFFRAEHRPRFEDPLEPRRHGHLLIELRALRQIRLAVEVLHLEHVRAALAGRRNQLRGVDFQKIPLD